MKKGKSFCLNVDSVTDDVIISIEHVFGSQLPDHVL